MQIVSTYFEGRIGQEVDGDLLRLWDTSWRRQGWATRVLTQSHARRHRDFRQTDPANYWQLALERAGGGLFSRFDVINYGLAPITFKHTCTLAHDSSVVWLKVGEPLLELADLYCGYCALLGQKGWEKTPLIRFSRDAVKDYFNRDLPKWQAVTLCGRDF